MTGSPYRERVTVPARIRWSQAPRTPLHRLLWYHLFRESSFLARQERVMLKKLGRIMRKLHEEKMAEWHHDVYRASLVRKRPPPPLVLPPKPPRAVME